MATFDIYTGYNGKEATSRSATHYYDGINPADALTKLVADEAVISDIRGNGDAELTEITAFDDDMVASVYPLESGAYELHIYIGSEDIAVTLPVTEFVSITDAADMLGVSRQRVHVMLQGGQLDGRKVGNAWMVNRASVVKRKGATVDVFGGSV